MRIFTQKSNVVLGEEDVVWDSVRIEAAIKPEYIEHFKRQLLLLEVSKSDVRVLFDGGGRQDRHELMIELFKRSFEDFPSPNTIRFWTFTGDNRPTSAVNGQPLFSISGPRFQSDYVIPDPYVLRWPQAGVGDFHAYCEKIRQTSQKKPIKLSAVWRGLTSQHAVRKFIVKNCEALGGMFDLKDTLPDTQRKDFVQMSDLPEWAVLVDMQGHGYSGRLKYLLHAYRPVIAFERLDWDAVTMCLEPGIHYTLCAPDISMFQYNVRKSMDMYDDYVKRSTDTVSLVKSLTSRKNVSHMLVKKIRTVVG